MGIHNADRSCEHLQGTVRYKKDKQGNKIGISLDYPDLFKIACVMEARNGVGFQDQAQKGVGYGVTYNLPDGTPIRKVIGNKWYEADEYRKKIEKELRESHWEIFTSKDILFSEFAKEYLRSKKAKSTAKTYTKYFYCIDRILVPYFGPYNLLQITP